MRLLKPIFFFLFLRFIITLNSITCWVDDDDGGCYSIFNIIIAVFDILYSSKSKFDLDANTSFFVVRKQKESTPIHTLFNSLPVLNDIFK